jgi:hypothetical protein
LGDIPLPLEIMENSANLGFAAACNQGALGSTADYLLFLNPDTRVSRQALTTVTRFMDSPAATRVGICGVQLVDVEGAPSISCERFPTLRVLFGKMTGLTLVLPRLFPGHHLTSSETRTSRIVDQVIGAFYFVRHDLFTDLRGFDERYFLYFEEVDFALRARRLGAESFFLKEARVFHAGNVSSDQVHALRLRHSLRSRLLFAYKHWPVAEATFLAALTITVELPARLAVALQRRSRSEVSATARAYGGLLSDLPRVWSSGRRRSPAGASPTGPLR